MFPGVDEDLKEFLFQGAPQVMLPPYSSPRPSRNKPSGPLMAPAALVRPVAS